MRTTLALAVTAALLAVPSPAGAATPAAQQCRGVTVERGAPVISRASRFVAAPVAKIWDLHAGIDAWASWIPEITPAVKKTPGPLRRGSVFAWSPQNMHVTSTVKAVEAQRCIAWGAPVGGIDGVHLWTFRPVRGGVVVTTEESWSGATVEADVPGFQALLDTGLNDWVDRLKSEAEGPLTCGGQGVDPKAKIRYRTSAVIKAPLRTVWRLQTDVERWPAWQPAVATIERLDHGRLRAGSAFRWTTPVPETATTPATTLVITSTVQQLKQNHCIRWTGPAVGDGLRIDRGVHVWNFTPVRGGVLVRTEETWTGAQVEADVDTSTAFLGAGLEAWLTDLDRAAR